MMKTTILSMAGVAAIVSVGCGSGGGSTPVSNDYVRQKPKMMNTSGKAAAGQEASYFPFAQGSQWTFESTVTNAVNGRQQATKTQEVTYRLEKVTPSPTGGQDATFTVLNDGKAGDQEVWRVDSKGLYQVSMGKTTQHPFSPPEPILLFPVQDKSTFKWQGTIASDKGEMRKSDLSGTVLGEQPIDTEMGQYNALAIEEHGTLTTGGSKAEMASTLWLIPNVGIGRYVLQVAGRITDAKTKRTADYQVTQKMTLKNVSLKK